MMNDLLFRPRRSVSETALSHNKFNRPHQVGSLFQLLRRRVLPLLGRRYVTVLLLTIVIYFLIRDLTSSAGVSLSPPVTGNDNITSSVQQSIKSSEPVSIIKATQEIEETSLRLFGFEFCTTLNNASFHANVVYENLKLDRNNAAAIMNAIDENAKKVYRSYHYKDNKPIDPSSLLRYSCYMAAHGKNSIVKSASQESFIETLDPKYHYPFFSWTKSAGVESTIASMPEDCKLKPYYKMAFLFLVHDSIESTKHLHHALSHPDSLILIHSDKRNVGFYHDLLNWTRTKEQSNEHCNTLLLSTPLPVIWGHSSIVLAQQEAFFQLMHLAKFDYVINLSNTDYPLETPDYMHSVLEKSPGKSYISYWEERRDERLTLPYLFNWEMKDGVSMWNEHRHFELDQEFKPMKHHQWMILSYNFIKQMHASESALRLLAWVEHTWIPDEMFYASWAVSSSSGINPSDIVNDMKRYVNFHPNAPSPDWVGMNDVSQFKEHEYFFVRKVNVAGDTEFRNWAADWSQRHQKDEQ